MRGNKAITVMGLSLLSYCLVIAGLSSRVAPESIEMDSFDPAQEQTEIAGDYRSQAITMRQKAAAQAAACMESLARPPAPPLRNVKGGCEE